MAAIIQPHRHLAPFSDPSEGALRPARAVRPALRLVPPPVRRRRPLAPVVSLAIALVLVVAVSFGAVAAGRGALAALAPAPSAAGASASAGSGPTVTVVVHAGDTLWSIARRLQPHGDVRALVDRLAAANGSTIVRPGQHLTVHTR